MTEQLTERELWLMKVAFENGQHYTNFNSWLSDHVCNEANVKMALENQAPSPSDEQALPDAAQKMVGALHDLTCECEYLSNHEIDGGAPDNRWEDMRVSLVKAQKILTEHQGSEE